MSVRSSGFVLCCLVFAASSLASAAEPGDSPTAFRFADESGRHLDILTPEGRPILRYVYLRDTSTPETTFDTGKVFAHVFAPDGTTHLTKGPGGTFPHHRGIFVGWNRLQQDDQRHDLWHVRNTAQVHREFVEKAADERGAAITARIDWLGTHGKPVVEETRTYRLVTQDGAHAVIDVTTELKAVGGDVVLDGDPEHAGVQYRPPQEVADNKSARYTFHEEDVNPQRPLDLPWVAATFRLGDQTWTVQHMSHPDNPPGARWSAYRDYGRFGPFLVITIPEGESQTLRYRFRITSGDAPDREALSEQHQEFAAG